MRTTAAIALTLASASVVFAQNSTSSSSLTLPESASQGCKSFLTTLNSNSAVSSCLNGLVTATSGFDSNNSSGNATSVDDTLGNICSTSFNSLCDPSVVRGALADFYTNCGSDMAPADGSAGNQEVIAMYDTLYLIVPLRNAICAKDPSSGKYCINTMTSGSSQKRDATLYERADQTTLTPDLASYRESGLPYLFLTPSTDMSILCSDCAARVIGSYVAFETVTPYALGVPNSKVLGGQVELWSKVQQCSNGLANQIMANSTGNTGNFSGATSVRVGMTGIVVALMSAVVATATLF